MNGFIIEWRSGWQEQVKSVCAAPVSEAGRRLLNEVDAKHARAMLTKLVRGAS